MIRTAIMVLLVNTAGMFNSFLAYKCAMSDRYWFAAGFMVISLFLYSVPKIQTRFKKGACDNDRKTV